MLSDFVLIEHQFDTPIDIYPISDVHLGASEHSVRAWELFCQDIINRKNAYITLGGDLMNNATRSSVSNVFDDVLRPREQKKIIFKMLEPLRDKILCCVTGNHERRSGKDVDDDPTYDIMCKLDLEHLYRENIAFMVVRLGKSTRVKHYCTYTFGVTHGAGGGALTGSSVNRNERFGYAVDGMDCLIVGHNHKPYVTRPSKIVIDPQNSCVTTKPFTVVSSTAWMDYGGYAAQKMMLPSSQSLQKISLGNVKKNLLVSM